MEWADKPRWASIIAGVALLISLPAAVLTVADHWPTWFPPASCGHHSDLHTLSPAHASASSTLGPAAGNSYAARNTIDGNSSTAWAPAGSDGGHGERLTISFAGSIDLRLVCIMNGYAKGDYVYQRNGKISDVTVATDQGEAVGALSVLPAESRYDTQPTPLRPGRTTKITITILSDVAGALINGVAGDRDTFVSELRFYGYE